LTYGFSVISRTGLLTNGNYTTLLTTTTTPTPIPVSPVSAALGSVDQNLALETPVPVGSTTKYVLKLYSPSSLSSKGTISFPSFTDKLTGLSQSFRTDLGGAAVIDIQGDVQSIRGQSANGMFLNDTGNLATIKIQQVDNSTIVGQPISHITVARRNNATFLTSSRQVGNRNGAMQVSNIQPIGPLSPANSS
jgi:hypothetical protein